MRETVGLGGGGAMYLPVSSPHLPAVLFVQCDMGGLYRSRDSGDTWAMIDGREMTASTNAMRCPVAFHPGLSNVIYAAGAYRGIRRSEDLGDTWTTIVSGAGGRPPVSALALDPSTGDLLLYGTEEPGPHPGPLRFDPISQSWVPGSDGQGNPLSGDVIDFYVDPSSPVGNRRCLLATRGKINGSPARGVFESVDNGQTWTPLTTLQLPSWSDIRSFTAGRDGTTGAVVLYVTVEGRIINGTYQGGVYRLDTTAAAAGWISIMNSGINNVIPTNADPDAPCSALAQYQWVAAAEKNPDIVFVSVCGTRSATDAKEGTAYGNSGVFRSTNGGTSWEAIFFFIAPTQPSIVNHDGGWFDWDVGFGSGGPAMVPDPNQGFAGGFSINRNTGTIALFTNKDALYVSIDALASPPHWLARYTRPAGARAPREPWRSNGLEVTTTWNYTIDPSAPQTRYLCYTDIGFARSRDGGETWIYDPPGARRGQKNKAFNTVYEVAFDPSQPGRVWAACSDQHDIPEKDWIWVRYGGGIARSDNYGTPDPATSAPAWTDFSGQLPNWAPGKTIPPPVVSVQVHPTTRRVWISVFGHGVFYSDKASTLAHDQGGQADWQDATYNLATTAVKNLNVYRLQLTADGSLYCAVTARRDPPPPSPPPPPPQPFVAETGLWKLPPGATQWLRITPAPVAKMNLATQSATNMWWLNDYAIHPQDPNIVYVCTAHVRKGLTDGMHDVVGGVLRTTNATAPNPVWQRVLALEPAPGTPVLPAEVLPQRYRDFVHAFAPVFDPRDPSHNTVYATTRTHGIWVTRNGGDPTVQPVWREDKSLPFMSPQRITFDTSDVYVTSYGGGAWTAVDARQWLRALYADLLGRPPDAGGLAYWVQQLRSGQSPATVANGFLASSEYCTMIITGLYQQLLDRTPDPGGLAWWVDALKNGTPLRQIILGFCDSPEYQSTNPAPEQFVESLYQRLLGRASDPGGKQWWIGALQAGHGTSEVINGFLNSQEYGRNRITGLYQTLLGRQSDAAGLTFWVTSLTGGTPYQQIQLGFLTSAEYRERALTRFP
jgi:hypothetical protein